MSPDEIKIYWDDPWISDRLEWLMENRPKQVERLFQEDPNKLLELLCEKVKQAWLNQQAREKRGQDRSQAAAATFEEVISPPSESRVKKQLPPEFQQKMRDWLSSLLRSHQKIGESHSKKAIEYPETTEFCRPIGSTSYFIKLHLLTI